MGNKISMLQPWHEQKKSNLKNDMDALRKVALFEEIKDEQGALERLAMAMTSKEFQPREYILHEGHSGSEMFILIEGQASVFKATSDGESYKIALLNSDQISFFGEGALLDSDARSASIQADTLCRCLILGRKEFSDFGKEFPHWALPVLVRIAQTVMFRLRKINIDMMLLYHALVSEIRGDHALNAPKR